MNDPPNSPARRLGRLPRRRLRGAVLDTPDLPADSAGAYPTQAPAPTVAVQMLGALTERSLGSARQFGEIPTSSMGFVPENLVRTGLSAGGRWIRTFGSPTDPLPFRDSQARLPSRFDLPTRNRWFESTSLQQRVTDEPVKSTAVPSSPWVWTIIGELIPAVQRSPDSPTTRAISSRTSRSTIPGRCWSSHDCSIGRNISRTRSSRVRSAPRSRGMEPS